VLLHSPGAGESGGRARLASRISCEAPFDPSRLLRYAFLLRSQTCRTPVRAFAGVRLTLSHLVLESSVINRTYPGDQACPQDRPSWRGSAERSAASLLI